MTFGNLGNFLQGIDEVHPDQFRIVSQMPVVVGVVYPVGYERVVRMGEIRT